MKKDSTKNENIIFIEELKKLIPNIENIKNNFVTLNHYDNNDDFYRYLKNQELTFDKLDKLLKEEIEAKNKYQY